MIINEQREFGEITAVYAGQEYGGIYTCRMNLHFKGSGQSFGGLPLTKEQLDDYTKELCNVFRVNDILKLKGKNCYALRSFDEFSANIDGLETINGVRFLHTVWKRKHFPDTKTPLEERIELLKNNIEVYKNNISSTRAKLKNIKSRYINWE